MDVIFALAYNEGISPVAVSLRKDIPLAGSAEADRILGFQHSAGVGGPDVGGLKLRVNVVEDEGGKEGSRDE